MTLSALKKNQLFLISFVITVITGLLGSCAPKESLPDPLEAGWEGKKVCEVLEDTEKMRVLKCTFAPGVGHEKHYHNPHFGYTIKGGKFQITDERRY